ncbi:alpha-hydroxy acid oxidase [Pseudonocardia parietis]|uniref:L-lactate dehydrogenase (Cytochrome) n=1 Tax=Pseudonocardia parietis TaxID=570936 RepID=A0ABS4VQI4_9PSEU|nr:alpha-hydroxy acid oxidase [Pseudonocardia parietis]MBP2366180.1 L-lactate dehydrogenase (cytochrome) [Pseudonocardia parietis]
MNDVVRLLRDQVVGAARELPGAAVPATRAARRVAAAGSVAEVRSAARRALPGVIFDFVDGAAGDEHTARRNVADLAEWEFAPRAMVDVSAIDLSTEVLGRRIALPVLGAPSGLCGLVHHEGERALARGVTGAGSVYTLAAMSSYSIEEVAAAASGPLWFQTYLWRDRGLVRDLLDRARVAGYEALVVTVDVPRAATRDRDRRNGFGLPPRVTGRTVLDAARCPAWTWNFLRRPRISAGSVATGPLAVGDSVSIASYVDQQFDPSATWSDLEWLRAQWTGPLVVKGLLRAADAERAVDLGADAVVVSNHGGRQLDHVPSSIRCLPAVVDAVGDRAEVLLDGGIRRGVDVLKALALGARACLVGRPVVFGLGAGGAAGVGRVMTIFEQELRSALALLGCASVRDLDPSFLVRTLTTTSEVNR